jgi:hypothetical protein
MRADTFAKLVILQTLIEAEVAFWLRYHPASMDRYREAMVTRVSDLVDQIDRLDEVAAARVSDALVDFLAELPDDDEGVVDAALRFQRSLDRLSDRAMEASDRDDPATSALVLDELLDELAQEYPLAMHEPGAEEPRALLRSVSLARAARAAGERLAAAGRDGRILLRDDLDRLLLAVEHRRLPPAEVEELIRGPQRLARRARPSPLGRVGAAVLGQLLRRSRGTPRIP